MGYGKVGQNKALLAKQMACVKHGKPRETVYGF
jgi:hypothetical protein